GDGKAERAAKPQNLRGDAPLVEEAQHEIEEHDEEGPIRDLSSPACSASSTTKSPPTISLAQALGEKEVADLLSQTLEEEKQTNLKLAEVTQKAIMPVALAGEEEEGGCPSGKRRDSRCPNL